MTTTSTPAGVTKINFNMDGKRVFSVYPDGHIELGPGFTTTDKASLLFWQAIQEAYKSLTPKMFYGIFDED